MNWSNNWVSPVDGTAWPKPASSNPWDAMSQDELLVFLNYDQITGIFTWKVSTNKRIKIGSIAGSIGPQGYVRIRINGKYYQAHRLAWLYVNGEWPKNEIDHKDRIKHHNWILNLREATKSQNGFNRTADKDNELGVKGVRRWGNKFIMQMKINGSTRYLGLYKTIEDAKKAYDELAKELHGEFACE